MQDLAAAYLGAGATLRDADGALLGAGITVRELAEPRLGAGATELDTSRATAACGGTPACLTAPRPPITVSNEARNAALSVEERLSLAARARLSAARFAARLHHHHWYE